MRIQTCTDAAASQALNCDVLPNRQRRYYSVGEVLQHSTTTPMLLGRVLERVRNKQLLYKAVAKSRSRETVFNSVGNSKTSVNDIQYNTPPPGVFL